MARSKNQPPDVPTALQCLLELVDEGYNKQSWHGPNLKGSLRGLKLDVALWRPAADRKNIWEIMLHAAYWKYTVGRRLTGEKRGSFPLKGSNWFDRPEGSDQAQWKDDLRLLEQTHATMRAAIESLKPAQIGAKLPGSKVTYQHLIRGVAFHDIYHAGQIQTIKRLASAG